MSHTQRNPAAAVAGALGEGAVAVVDVGARWGAADAWYRLHPLARLIGFDPDPPECARLNAAVPTGRRELYVPLALGAADGPATLYETVEPMCSSLLPPDERLADRFPVLDVMRTARTHEIRTTTLAGWAAAEGATDVRFVKIDVQGAELDVLRGCGPALDDCLGLEVEVQFVPMYRGAPAFADVDAYLRGRGFTLWRLGQLTHYTERPREQRLAGESETWYDGERVTAPAGSGRLVWANALYFRDWVGLPNAAAGGRDALVLAALLDAAGDRVSAGECLGWGLPRAGLSTAAAEKVGRGFE